MTRRRILFGSLSVVILLGAGLCAAVVAVDLVLSSRSRS